jgi:hexulose-6-phosphate isomerase
MKNRIGVMQGRLSPPTNGKIQSFPWASWEAEFSIAQKLNLNLIEWTLDKDKIFDNPLLTEEGQAKLFRLISETNVRVESLTCDNLMQSPVHKDGTHGRTSKVEFIEMLTLLPKVHDFIIVWPLVDGGSIDSLDELKLLKSFVLDIIPVLREFKFKIAFETQISPKKNSIFLSNFPTDVVGLNLDIGNCAANGFSVQEDYDLNGARIFNIHIKDRLFGGRTIPLGQGDVIWSDFEIITKKYFGPMIFQSARIENQSEEMTILSYLNFCKENNIFNYSTT